jgi:hypothetical protein
VRPAGQRDDAAAALEESHTHAAFHGSHEIADAGGGQPQPLGGASEVQFLGNAEKRLDFPHLQHWVTLYG